MDRRHIIRPRLLLTIRALTHPILLIHHHGIIEEIEEEDAILNVGLHKLNIKDVVRQKETVIRFEPPDPLGIF